MYIFLKKDQVIMYEVFVKTIYFFKNSLIADPTTMP